MAWPLITITNGCTVVFKGRTFVLKGLKHMLKKYCLTGRKRSNFRSLPFFRTRMKSFIVGKNTTTAQHIHQHHHPAPPSLQGSGCWYWLIITGLCQLGPSGAKFHGHLLPDAIYMSINIFSLLFMLDYMLFSWCLRQTYCHVWKCSGCRIFPNRTSLEVSVVSQKKKRKKVDSWHYQ